MVPKRSKNRMASTRRWSCNL